MQDASQTRDYVLSLTNREAEYLNAATCEFFHKMRDAMTDGLITDFESDRYQTAVSLWVKVEEQIQIKERKE